MLGHCHWVEWKTCPWGRLKGRGKGLNLHASSSGDLLCEVKTCWNEILPKLPQKKLLSLALVQSEIPRGHTPSLKGCISPGSRGGGSLAKGKESTKQCFVPCLIADSRRDITEQGDKVTSCGSDLWTLLSSRFLSVSKQRDSVIWINHSKSSDDF